MFRKSQFNHEAALPGTEDTVCYNFRSHRFARLNPLQKLIFDSGPFESVFGGLLGELYEKGMLTDGDELESLREEIRKNRREDRTLHLSIDVNSKCNFACEYCLETGQLGGESMNRETAEGVIRFIRHFIERGEIDRVELVWFGGEPMLDPEIIEEISGAVIPCADAHHVPLSAVIYTNGYLLTKENIRLLEKCRVQAVRVSLDGPGEMNDRFRHLKNGRGTYDRIMRNIRDTKTDMIYRIRCNLNKENLGCYEAFVEEMKRLEQESGNRIAVSPERMKVEEHVRPELKNTELSQSEYISVYRSVKSCVVREEDLDVFSLHFPKKLPCSACKRYGFTVDIHGNIRKCRWIPGDRGEHILGRVQDPPDTYEEKESTRRFLTCTLPEKQKCLSCKLLPVCKGRCALQMTDPERYSCHRLIRDLDWAVLTLYNKCVKP